MRLVRFVRLVGLFMVCALFLGLQSRAQLVKGSIAGAVTDTSGAVLQNASVTATEVNTNFVVTSQTNGSGFYIFPNLDPGTYTIRVTVAGFQAVEHTNIVLHTGGALNINVQLPVGKQEETVTVAASTEQLLDGETPTLSQTMDTMQVNELPISQRNIMALVVFLPGVVTTTAGTQIGAVGNRNYFDNGYAVNGSRTSSNEVLLDGVPNTIGDFNGIGVSPPIGSVNEYTVITGVPSAQYGRSSGGAVTITTRSGTNKFHGEAYGFLQNSFFNANSWTNKHNHVARTSSDNMQFGGNISGPVLIPHLYNGHDKTFFFFDYEGHRERNPVTDLVSVPTDALRGGDFSGVPYTIYDPATTACTTAACSAYTRTAFTSNQIPTSRFDSLAKNLLKYWPEPNVQGAGYTNNYYYAGVEPEHKNLYDIRIDHNQSQQHTFFGRYIYERHSDTTPDFLGTGASSARSVNDLFQNVVLGDDYTFFKSVINDFRFGVTRAHAQQVPISDGVSPTTLGFPSSIAAFAPELEFPTIGVSGHVAATALGGQGFNNQPRETWSIADGIIKVLGNHQLRFGTDLRLYRFYAYQSTAPDGSFAFNAAYTQKNPTSADSTTGAGLASFLLGAVAPGGYIEYVTRLSVFHPYLAFYGNDTWKVTRKLTINAGLRWEREGGTEESRDRLTYFNTSMASPVSGTYSEAVANADGSAGTYTLNGVNGALNFTGDGNPRAITETPWKMFQPRVGFSYALNDNTVLRGGYAILALPQSLETTSAQGFNIQDSIPQSSAYFVNVYLSNMFPNGIAAPTGKSTGTSTDLGSAITAVLRDVDYPYNQIWTFGVQRAIKKNWMVEADYIGSHGLHLPMNAKTMSQLPDSYLAYGTHLEHYVNNPFYGQINNGGTLSLAHIVEGQLFQTYPQYTNVSWTRPNIGKSWYDSLQVKVNKRLSYGLSMQASYNWSKTLDLGGVGNGSAYTDATSIQDVYNLNAEKAVSDQDVPNALLVSGVANLPFGKGALIGSHLRGWKNALVGGWQASGDWRWQSGRPFPLTATNSNAGFGNPHERPNVVSGQVPNYSLSTARYNTEHGKAWFNTSAFSLPAAYTYGNMPRNLGSLRTDAYGNIDLSMHKNFPIYARFTGQFRAEAFDVLNQVVFATPDNTLTDAGFGVATSMANSPRTWQFALRIMF